MNIPLIRDDQMVNATFDLIKTLDLPSTITHEIHELVPNFNCIKISGPRQICKITPIPALAIILADICTGTFNAQIQIQYSDPNIGIKIKEFLIENC